MSMYRFHCLSTSCLRDKTIVNNHLKNHLLINIFLDCFQGFSQRFQVSNFWSSTRCFTEMYLRLCTIYKTEFFCWKYLLPSSRYYFAKSSILDVWWGSKYTPTFKYLLPHNNLQLSSYLNIRSRAIRPVHVIFILNCTLYLIVNKSRGKVIKLLLDD